mgnify:CR=1 FL=1
MHNLNRIAMETNQTIFRRWEDLVFENRNKLYGAYLLRTTYANHLLSGLGVSIFVVTVILALHAGSRTAIVDHGSLPPFIAADLIDILPPPIIQKPVVAKQEPRAKKASGPVVVTREEVEEFEAPEPLADFVSGDGTGIGDIAPIEGDGIFEIPQPEPPIEPGVLDIAEVMPQYEGGIEAMMKFIQKKIRYPRVPRELGIEGTVYVAFVVTGDGSVADVKVIKGVHPDYDEEAMRVISMLPLWKGGSHNGRPVSVKMVMPIKFNIK